MPTVKEALVKIGVAGLSQMLGRSTVSILEALDIKNVSSSAFADLIIAQHGEASLLLDRQTRQTIIETLSQGEASRLASLLGNEAPTNPWEAVLAKRFSRKSHQLNLLYSFFGGIVADQDEGEQDDKQPVTHLEPDYPLFEHQIVACREAISALSGQYPRVLLHMPTGAGKTRTAMNIIAHFMRSDLGENEIVIWLAHSEELCEQAAEEFEKAWKYLGIRPVEVHRCFGRHRVDLSMINSGFVVGGLQLLYSRSHNEQSAFFDMARSTRLVIMDEAHQAIAPTYKHLLQLIAAHPATKILGLSATPGRSTIDALQDLKLADFFHRQKVSLKVKGYKTPVDFLQEEGYLAKVEYEPLSYQVGPNIQLSAKDIQKISDGFDIPDHIVKELGEDEARNLLIVNQLTKYTHADDKVIVFACSVEHAHMLANILRMKGVSAGVITGKTNSEERRDLIEKFKHTDEIQVLTNYGVLTTGFDAPRTNVALIARPTNSVVLYSQMVGRAARGVKAGGNEKCKIITIVDDLPGFRSIAEGFEYWEEIWEI